MARPRAWFRAAVSVISLIAILFTDLPNAEHVKDYRGYHLITVRSQEPAFQKALRDAQAANHEEMTILSGPTRRQPNTTFLASNDLWNDVLKQQLKRERPFVLDTDVGRHVAAQNRQIRALNEKAAPGAMRLDSYNRYDTILKWLEELEATNPLCSLETIGHTFEGRPMKLLKISDGSRQNKPIIWIDAGIHAREYIAPATALNLINYLLSEHDSYEEVWEMVSVFDWYFLPVANPDGYEYTWDKDRFWRKTRSTVPGRDCVGVDPNRNWDNHWAGEGTDPNPCSEIYPGPRAFSEPETDNMARKMTELAGENGGNIKLYITLHSYGQLWLYPWGYDTTLPNNWAEMDALGHIATDAIMQTSGKEYTVGSSAQVLYPAAGCSDDWAKSDLGVRFSYTVELSPDFYDYAGFDLDPEFIQPVGYDTWMAMREFTGALKWKVWQRNGDM